MTDHVAHTSTGPVRLPTIDHVVVTCDNDYNDVRVEIVNGVGVGDVAQRAHSDAEDADRGVIAVIELEQVEKVAGAIQTRAQAATTLPLDEDARRDHTHELLVQDVGWAIEVLEAVAPDRREDEGHYANRALTYLHRVRDTLTPEKQGPFLGPVAQAQVEWLFGVQPTKGDQR